MTQQVDAGRFNLYKFALPLGEKLVAFTDRITPSIDTGLSEINLGLIGLMINEVPLAAKVVAALTLAHGLTIFAKPGIGTVSTPENFLLV